MQERLIEHWLDSINERGYQSAFLQMLSGEGHTIIHSTRHNAFEFGKDVVSIDPSGVPCAFQLKGNPGTRLTLTQFREIKPQIDQLVEQPIVFPGVPDVPHKCYLVTNGEVEEEVQRSVDDLNRGYERRGFPSNTRLHLVTRGMLLDWATKHSTAFWTENFSIHDKLIKLYNENGSNPVRLDLISQGLDEILQISSDNPNVTATDIERRQISASLFVAFGVRNYTKNNNYIAVAAVYAALFVSLECALDRHRNSKTTRSRNMALIAREGFLSAVLQLANELGSRLRQLEADKLAGKDVDYNVVFLAGGPLSDHFLWRARGLVSVALISLLSLEISRTHPSIPTSADALKAIEIFTKPGVFKLLLWGEGAIPQFLAVIFNWHANNPTLVANLAENDLLIQLTNAAMSKAKGYIATPYHTDEEAMRDQIGNALGLDRGSVEKDTMKKSSFFVEALFHCFVRSNFKTSAKMLWPSITKIFHNRFFPENTWEYCLWRVEKGDNQSAILPPRQNWTDMQIQAADTETPHIPSALRDDPLMLLAFIVFFPHRALPEVIRFLHFSLCGTWFLPVPRPPRN